MTDTIAVWRAEHLNFAKLLDILEEQLERFHTDEGPNYELMLDIMFYMTHYSDLLHHPREDLALAKIKERQTSAGPLVDELMRQHTLIKECGEELVTDLDGIVNGSILSREQVEVPGRNYIANFRSHMQTEESEILPLAAKLLRDKDWSKIEATIQHLADPLFGSSAEQRYAALRHEIAREAGQEVGSRRVSP
jgi:hemerythrin-like domain-containing protein